MHQQHRVIFMTDPICSWCWGMLPEMQKTREALGDHLQFTIRCAGLQVGPRQPLSEARANELIALWQQVAETTGQTFAYRLPDDTSFVYHSEIACRAIQACRNLSGTEPWTAFERLQRAFYIDCMNITDPETLIRILDDSITSRDAFLAALTSNEIIEATRAEFAWCEAQAIQALPTVFLDQGAGPKLVCGGYATAEYLIPELTARLSAS